MKKLFVVSVFAALSLAACTNLEPDVTPVNTESDNSFTITAQTESSATKAGISGSDATGYDVVWEEGDEVFVYTPSGAGYASGEIRVKGSGTTSATLDTNLPLINGADVWSPASLGGSIEYGLSWPSRQSYSATNGVSGIPMYGTASPVVDGKQKVQFKNLGGLLRFTLKAPEDQVLTGIEISASSPLAGYFNIVKENGAPVPQLVLDSGYENDASNSIELTCGEGVALNTETGKDFYINMMPGEYSGVTVKFIFAGHVPVIKQLGKPLVINRSEITPATLNVQSKSMVPGRLVKVSGEHDLSINDIFDMAVKLTGQSMIKLALLNNVINPVHVANIVYITKDRAGNLVEASGVVAYQYNSGSQLTYDRIVSFQHGTCDIANAPSLNTTGIATELLPACVVADYNNPVYYVAVMADYLGYGVSQTPDLQTPYMHSALTGGTCADMITAAKEFLEFKEIEIANNKLDLVGYSQGGAATLQTLLELESRGISNDEINEVWAGAGPYDLLGFIDFFKNKENVAGKPGHVPFAIRGIAYGDNLSLNNSNIYNSSLLTSIDLDNMFTTKQLSEWHSLLNYNGGEILRMSDILHPDFFVDGYNSNTDIIALTNALKANSVVSQSRPANYAKIKLYHSETDDTVPYSCSEALREKWAGMGEVNTLTVQNNHVNAGIEFMLTYSGLTSLIPYLK